MTLASYQIFKTVAEIGSFHKAADVLGLTPSAISHSISAMEKELGFSVLTRSKAGVTLTGYGEHILPYVNAVLNSDESLQQVVSEYKGLTRGKVKIGCFSSACTSFIPAIIRSFGELYPAIQIEVFEGTYEEVAYWLKSGVADIGFLSASSAGDLQIEPFYRDPLLCIVPADYKKKNDSPYMTAEEMKDLQFVVQRGPTDADIQNFLKSNHLDIHTRYHVVDDLSTVALVASGLGICIMPELTMKDIPYDVRRYPLDPAAHRMIGLAVLNPSLMSPAVRALYQHILERYGNLE